MNTPINDKIDTWALMRAFIEWFSAFNGFYT